MDINRNNYEAYFIDYLEDNLDKNIVDDFIEFLQQNPDLKEELKVLSKVSVVAENIEFSKKERLYKEKLDSEKEFNQTAIASLEDDISVTEKREFNNYIEQHPDKKRDVALFSKTKLVPDKTVIFRNKKRLYHRPASKITLLWAVRIAAVFILAFAFFTLFNTKPKPVQPVNILAEVKKTEASKPAPALTVIQPNPEKKAKPIIKNRTKKEKPVSARNNKNIATTKSEQPSPTITETGREPAETLPELSSIAASLNVKQPKLKMATMHLKIPDDIDYYSDERLLADRIKEKIGFEKIELNKVAKAGLNMMSTISKNKFKYETNEKGKITKYNYESRLIAFSIPSKNTSSK